MATKPRAKRPSTRHTKAGSVGGPVGGPEAFFYEWGSYSWDPKTQTKDQGRRESAKALATAEAYAAEQGWGYMWEDDPEGWDPGMLGDNVDPADISEILSCVLKDMDGNVLASLGGIQMGFNSAMNRKHGRVFEAELAQEAMASVPRKNPWRRNPRSNPAVSAKSLKEWFKGGARRIRLSEEDAQMLAKELRAASGHDEVDAALETANRVLDGHGIEAISGNWHDHYYQDIVGLYVNMGDTYDPTIVYNTVTEGFVVTTMGDWVEAYQRKYGII